MDIDDKRMQDIENEFLKILQEEINREILNEVREKTLESKGYTRVEKIHHRNIDEAWVQDNIKGRYEVVNDRWHFELKDDAILFIMRWK